MPTSIDQENSGTSHPANGLSSSQSTALEPTNQLHDSEGTNRDYDNQVDISFVLFQSQAGQ